MKDKFEFTEHERAWVEFLRLISNGSDPKPTLRRVQLLQRLRFAESVIKTSGGTARRNGATAASRRVPINVEGLRLTRVYMIETVGNLPALKWCELAPILAFRVYLKFPKS